MTREALLTALLTAAVAAAAEPAPAAADPKTADPKAADAKPMELKLDAPAEPKTDAPEDAPVEEPKPEEPKEIDESIAKWRNPLDALAESNIGLASRAVLFDWRRSTVGFGFVGSALLELNNFSSWRAGGFVRIPVGNLQVEFAVTRAVTNGSQSTALLSLTPYRQSARPTRMEFDLNASYALFEGVGTPRLSLIPAAELVLQLNLGFRYLYYYNALGTANFGQVLEAVFSPRLTQRELDYLEKERLPGMQLDPGRYNLLLGFQLDLYFRTGVFLAPRVMVALPLLSGASGSSLGWWWELSMMAGWQI